MTCGSSDSLIQVKVCETQFQSGDPSVGLTRMFLHAFRVKNEINIISRKIKNMIKMTSFMILLSEHESDKAVKVKKSIKVWETVTKAFSISGYSEIKAITDYLHRNLRCITKINYEEPSRYIKQLARLSNTKSRMDYRYEHIRNRLAHMFWRGTSTRDLCRFIVQKHSVKSRTNLSVLHKHVECQYVLQSRCLEQNRCGIALCS